MSSPYGKPMDVRAVLDDLEFMRTTGEGPVSSYARLVKAGSVRPGTRKALLRTLKRKAREQGFIIDDALVEWFDEGAYTRRNEP